MKRVLVSLFLAILSILVLLCLFKVDENQINIEYDITYLDEDYLQIFYSDHSDQFTEERSESYWINDNKTQHIVSTLSKSDLFYRIDFGEKSNTVDIKELQMYILFFHIDLEADDIISNSYIKSIAYNSNGYTIEAEGLDSQVIFDLSDGYKFLCEKISKINNNLTIIYFVLGIIFGIIVFLLYEKIKALIWWFIDILRNRKLIMQLAYNDFKMRYAASYLGTFWAFAQPVVTVLIYVFVFGFGLKSNPVSDMPYSLWLIAGIIPWFLFQDAWLGATNSLMEYSYLVKKVVFKISVLPIVKIISAIFVHLFFVILGIIMFWLFGYSVNISIIQIIYYSFCTLAFTLGLAYITSACMVFFKDVGQLVGILLQIWMWLTPIMWKSDLFGSKVEKLLMLNPMYYIVEGYRDSFYAGIWFWEKPYISLYFWLVVCILILVGIKIFKGLEKHFADVL